MQDRDPTQGQSWRVRYSKDFATTGTHFAIAGYRYNSKGFYTLQDTLDSHTLNDDWEAPDTRRDRQEATVDQSLGGTFGSLTLSLVKEATGTQARDDLNEHWLQQLMARHQLRAQLWTG
jgi:outer membrane usher protein